MRVVNTNHDAGKKFRRFSLPGFRSGSLFNKIIALCYYVFILVYMCVLTLSSVDGSFSGSRDIIIFILVELSILAVLLTPVIAIGLSNHYDWHGIKLFIIIMIPLCFFMTLGQWLSSCFSMQYIESINPSVKQIEQKVDSSAQSSGEIVIDD